MAAALVAALTWLWFFRETTSWFVRALADRGGTNLVLLLCATGVALYLLRLREKSDRAKIFARLSHGPRHEPLTLLFAFSVAVLALIAERMLRIHTLGAALFALGTYALSRLYLQPATWRRGTPLLMLLIFLLPVQDHLDAFVGFPLRVVTARGVSELLGALHIRATSAESILVLENGVAHVDLPCSGVKSLWAGAIFYFAATWLLQRRLGLKWLVSGFTFAMLLLCANAMRVLILVLLLLVFDAAPAAQSLHVPLGVLGFLGSCAVALLLLRRAPALSSIAILDEKTVPRLKSAWLFSFAAGLLLLSLLVARPAPLTTQQDTALSALKLPNDLILDELPLTAGEQSLFFQHGGVLARKWSFRQENRRGSLLLVMSRSFRAHHPPEVCLAAAGLRVDGMGRVRVGAGTPSTTPFNARMLSIESGARAAFYWFQSRDRTTDSLLARTLDDFSLRRQPWVLTAVLLDGKEDAMSPALQHLLIELHDAVAALLKGIS